MKKLNLVNVLILSLGYLYHSNLAAQSEYKCKHIEFAELKSLDFLSLNSEFCQATLNAKYALAAAMTEAKSIPNGAKKSVLDAKLKKVDEYKVIFKECNDENMRIIQVAKQAINCQE